MVTGELCPISTLTPLPPTQGRIWQTKHIQCCWGVMAAPILTWCICDYLCRYVFRLITTLAIQDSHFAFPVDDNITSASCSTPAKPVHSHHDSLVSSTHDSVPLSRKPSSSAKSKAAMTQKCSLTSLKDVFAEGSARENQMLEHLGAQKHERAIGEQELKVMERQHQRECKHEQHEYRMMQMHIVMAQNQRATPSSGSQPPYEGLGLMAELNDALLPPDSSFPQQYSV